MRQYPAPPQEVIEALHRLPSDALRRVLEAAAARDPEVQNLVIYEATTGSRTPSRYGGHLGDYGLRDDPTQPEHYRWASTSFMLFSFKVKPCHNTKPHNFRLCPFGHPPNWIRRDARVHRYVPVPCPYQQAGSCTLDGCPYAHSLLECSLHPFNYRNSRCRHGQRCTETVCFFAHSDHELRKPSKQYNPSLEEFKMAEDARPLADRAKVHPDALAAAEAKARTLLRSAAPLSSVGVPSSSALTTPVAAEWPPLPSQSPVDSWPASLPLAHAHGGLDVGSESWDASSEWVAANTRLPNWPVSVEPGAMAGWVGAGATTALPSVSLPGVVLPLPMAGSVANGNLQFGGMHGGAPVALSGLLDVGPPAPAAGASVGSLLLKGGPLAGNGPALPSGLLDMAGSGAGMEVGVENGALLGRQLVGGGGLGRGVSVAAEDTGVDDLDSIMALMRLQQGQEEEDIGTWTTGRERGTALVHT